MKKLWIIPGALVVGLLAFYGFTWSDRPVEEEALDVAYVPDTNAVFDILEDSEFEPGIAFIIDEGFRVDYGSNPRIMDYEDGVIELAFEYHADDLYNEPGQRGRVAYSYDEGMTFEDMRQFEPEEQYGKGILMPSGIYRRYHEEMDGYVYSQSSENGLEFMDEEGVRYDLNEFDDGHMGVRTYLLDEDGGTVLFYNHDVTGNDGQETILVRRAYSEPGDEGLNFVFEDDNVLEFVDEEGRQMSFADPHAILLSDGRIRLIVMNQDPDGPMPPLGRTGTLYSFISDDGGRTFDLEARIAGWDDFDEWEVRSLNDPKIMLLDDGRYRIYVAAMIPDEEANEEASPYKYVLVSLTSQ